MIEVHCSSLPRIEACPGSILASEGINTPDSPLALSGTIIHGALESWARRDEPDDDKLGDREQMIYRWFRSQVESLEQAHGGYMVRMPEIKIRVEYEGFALVGRLDLLIIPNDGSRHIIDYKSGYAEQVPAKSNRQLSGYVIGAYHQFPEWEDINAHLFSAGDPKESRFTSSVYDQKSIVLATRYIEQIITAGLKKDAPRTPGKHCQYCPALGSTRCPETADNVIIAKDKLMITPPDVLPVPARCGEIFDAIKAVERFSKTFMVSLKEAVNQNPEAWSDIFGTKKGSERRSFTNSEKACERLIELHNFTPKEIWPAVSITPSKVEGLIKERVKSEQLKMRIKDVKPMVNETFADLIETKQSAPSLVRVK